MFQPRSKPRLACLLVPLSLLLWAPASFAERADHDMPINMEADQVVIDDAHQISTFTGNVRLSQGSLMIRGDKIVVVQDKSGFKRATAYGNTAEFRQRREGTEGYVEGFGERIEYDTQNETVNLYKQARLKRGQDEVRGEHISYSAKTEIFQVEGSEGGLNAATPQRARAVLQPRAKEDATAKPSPNVQHDTQHGETQTPRK